MILTNMKTAVYDAETPPCMGCGSRCVNCHAECPRYAAWNEEHLKRKEAARLARQIERVAWTPTPVFRRRDRR